MWRAWSGLLAVAMLGAMAPSVEAQSFVTPLNGRWELNIPQEPYGPTIWTLKETAGVVTGTTAINDVPGVDISGEMNGDKLFLTFYLLNSDFEIDSGVEEIPVIGANNVSLVLVLMGRVQGFGLTTIDGVPFAVYQVTGRKRGS